jgi:hypothetical protein
MRIKHINPTQQVPNYPGFLPLLRDEVPYFQNLNRPALSAYTYADNINTIFSYGGAVSILQPALDSSEFLLYQIVRITDDEIAVHATVHDPLHARYGIVVAEAEIDSAVSNRNSIVVCTFCPNFVYPTKNLATLWNAIPGDPLYLNTDEDSLYLSGDKTTFNQDTIGYAPLAVCTGSQSIFFAGTCRALFAPSGVPIIK